MTSKLYRNTIRFADGTFTVAVWAADPARALEMALIDARMGQPTAIYSGAVLDFKVEAICELRIDAHAMDDDVEARILRDYNVRVIERKNAPWEWVFEGTRESLHRMFRECWGDEDASVEGLDIREVQR